MSVQLTDRQQNVYNMIRSLIVERGYGPTVREIGEHFGIKSPNGVMCHLRALERKGLIKRSPNKSRAIELTQAADRNGHSLQVAGIVKSHPAELAANANDRIDFAEMFFKEGRCILQVSGDALVNSKIIDGDYVIVQMQDKALPGQLVLAQLPDGTSTLRYWHPESDHVRLDAANKAVESLRVKDAKVIGVAIGMVRGEV